MGHSVEDRARGAAEQCCHSARDGFSPFHDQLAPGQAWSTSADHARAKPRQPIIANLFQPNIQDITPIKNNLKVCWTFDFFLRGATSLCESIMTSTVRFPCYVAYGWESLVINGQAYLYKWCCFTRNVRVFVITANQWDWTWRWIRRCYLATQVRRYLVPMWKIQGTKLIVDVKGILVLWGHICVMSITNVEY